MKTKLLIEQHFHGAFGIDFNKASVDDILYLSKEILKYGIGGIFPTIVTDSIENTKHAIKNIKEASQKQTSDMAKILGIHLEGIFINPEKKGIHNPKHFLAPTIENYKLIEDDFIKIVTLAPEMTEGWMAGGMDVRLVNNSNSSETSQTQQTDKDLSPYRPIALSPNNSHTSIPPYLHTSNLINYLSSQGIKVQAGHCTGGDLTGCSGVTHLFNAMSGITHRGKSTALSALINDDIYTEIIADGVHVSDDALELLFKTKPIDKIILISDCLPCTALFPRPLREELLNERSEFSNSGEGLIERAGQEGRLEIEGKKTRGLEGKLFNNSDVSDISQQPQTDKNLSTVQPFNHSTDNSLPSCSPDLHAFVFADETIYYDGVKAVSKEGTLAGSTTLLPDIIKRLAILFEDMSGKWKMESGKLDNFQLSTFNFQLKTISSLVNILINNPYIYHNIDLNGSIEWDEDWNILKVSA